MKRSLLCLALLLFNATALADQDDPRLDDLFKELKNADSPVAAAPIEELIWQIWTEHADPGIENQMQLGIQQMNAGDASAALATFDRLVEAAPDFAEAWNKRATIHYLLGNNAASEADIVKTLQLEPYHFGALSGRGLVLVAQGKFEEARNAFSRALEVYPAMIGVKNNIDEINAYLSRRTI
jgi:tetratricopeptide (TPR) repeat protein